MSIRERRARERRERERLIVDAARELAEAEGWEAVTTRRLAERIEYSQPVLYSHFKGKDAIMAAVAVEGFAELAAAMRAARAEAGLPETGPAEAGPAEAGPAEAELTGAELAEVEPAGAGLAGVARAYADFAVSRPVLYEAMFTNAVDLAFAAAETPAALRAAFGELRAALRPLTGDDDLDARTEVFWAALHGLVTLDRGGRLSPGGRERRLDLLLRHFGG